MKKVIGCIFCIAFAFSCNNNKSANAKIETTAATDTVKVIKNDKTAVDTIQQKNIKIDSSATDTVKAIINKDSVLLSLRKEILTSIKNKDYNKFSSFIHPVDGVEFSPYGFIVPDEETNFSATEFVDKVKNTNLKITWGSYDGREEDIKLSVKEYFKTFVYDVDFLNADKISVNKILGSGNSLNNIKEIYKNADFVESYFPGFDKKLEGMDWRTLRLVFKKHNNQYYLVAVIHDQWTI